MRTMNFECGKCGADITPRPTLNDEGLRAITIICPCGWFNSQHLFASLSATDTFDINQSSRELAEVKVTAAR